jgi:hypothetical protein
VVKVMDTDKMLIVERPEYAPGHCMATLKHEDPKGFIDTMLSPPVMDPRVYISVSWVEEMAGKLGMVYVEDAGKDSRRIEELEEQLREADAVARAIDVMESAGFTSRQKRNAARKTPAKKSA